MSKEKLYGLRDQLSKFLYDPTPDQAAWRDKMWEEGRFDREIVPIPCQEIVKGGGGIHCITQQEPFPAVRDRE